MSVSLNLNRKNRPYKIDVFGLQDNFISTLQAYEDTALEQIVSPKIEISQDGTQTFSCKIPKYYLSEIPNERVVNPRWKDVQTGILAENTRILKVSIQFSENDIRVYPFIIDKIVNRRDANFTTYKEVTGNGLAFAELGKTGYKIELNSTILEEDFAKDSTTLATIDYWLDKVFPNEKDEDGVVTKWLTPWCYEIRMDWRGYFEELSKAFIDGGTAAQLEGYNFYNSRNASYVNRDKNWLVINAGTSGPLYQGRDETKIYESPYISDWKVSGNKLRPISVESFTEKARYVDCKNSNKYNITQTLAETFEVFCTYEYACDQNGYFKKTYWDEYGNVWTGKKVVFFNRAIKTDNPYTINYQHNLHTIARTVDSSEVYTKMYVNPVASETMDTGYVTIADTSLNPLLDDFILNFDYMHEVGSINDLQKQEVEDYKVKLHELNKRLIGLEEDYNELTVKLNELESQKAVAESSLASAQEQVVDYETLRDNEVTNTPVIRDKTNSYSVIMVPQTNFEIVQGTFRLQGINAATIKGFPNNRYESGSALFSANELISAQAPPSTADAFVDKWYITYDEYGFPATIFTSKNNPIFQKGGVFGANFNISTGAVIYLELEYCPKNKYEAICEKFYSIIRTEQSKIDDLTNQIGSDEGDEDSWFGLKKDIKINEQEREKVLNEKNALNFRLERILGPALREGYWQPESYEDPGEGHNDVLQYNEKPREEKAYYIFDEELFEEEQKNYYYASSDDVIIDKKTYYPYIDLSNIYKEIGWNNSKISSFCISLLHPVYEWEIQTNNTLIKGGKYYVLLDGKYYWFQLDNDTYVKGDVFCLNTLNKTNANGSIAIRAPYISVKRNGITYKSGFPAQNPGGSETIPDGMNGNLTNAFMGVGQYLSSRHLYANAGFIFSFLKKDENTIIPVALLQQTDIDYSRYQTVYCSFNSNETIVDRGLKISQNTTPYPIVYPRFFLDYRNVNYDSDNFRVSVTQANKKLTKFEDYTILLRKGRVYVTLKVTDNNILNYIYNEPYNLIYQVSRANEMLYLDAKRVAKDSSKPKYSYEVTVANLPEEQNSLELGQLVYISDFNVEARKEYGYISAISYQLDKPSEDSLTIANYKTKFEDLFSSISAQNEAMKQNQTMYNIAAASFTSSGEVEKEVLQTTLNNNNFAFNFSNTNITLDDTGGLILTNINQYNNGVYGQVALRGGGIFCSNSVDAEGNRIWTTGITPEGVNASLVTAGRLDTNLIRIYAGDTLAFQWNSEGLFAYKEESTDGRPTLNEKYFVRLNEEGLAYVNDGSVALELGWNGLHMEGANGHLKITGDSGLQMFNDNNVLLTTFGKYNGNYGMFFTDTSGNVVLQAKQDGTLKLDGMLQVGKGTSTAGLSGTGSFRFWSGTPTPTTSSPFRVDSAGNVYAKNLNSSVATLNLLSEEELPISTIGATVIAAEAYLYAPEMETQYLSAEGITANNLTLEDGKLIFTKGDTKAILSFNGTKLEVIYE